MHIVPADILFVLASPHGNIPGFIIRKVYCWGKGGYRREKCIVSNTH